MSDDEVELDVVLSGPPKLGPTVSVDASELEDVNLSEDSPPPKVQADHEHKSSVNGTPDTAAGLAPVDIDLAASHTGLVNQRIEGSLLAGWTKRILQLTGRMFRILKTEKDLSPVDAQFVTSDWTVESYEAPQHPYGFAVNMTGPRKWLFTVESPAAKEEWIRQLQARIQADPIQQVLSIAAKLNLPKLSCAEDLTRLQSDRTSGSQGWKTDAEWCALCSLKIGPTLTGTSRRWHCKHCGCSCCLRCAGHESKRKLTKFGFNEPVRCCIECTLLLDAQEAAVTAMTRALGNHNVYEAETLLRQGLVDLNFQSQSGDTPLIVAVLKRNHVAVTTLLDLGANVNFVSRTNKTALIAAASCCADDLPLFNLLVARGGEVGLETPAHETALLSLATTQSPDALPAAQVVSRRILELGVSINVPHSDTEFTVLMKAAAVESPMLSFLIEQGASLLTADKNGHTALFYAALANKPTAIATLVAAGAAINHTANDVSTALILAVRAGCLEAVQQLLKLGASVVIANNDGINALAMALSCVSIPEREEAIDVLQNRVHEAMGIPVQPRAPTEAAANTGKPHAFAVLHELMAMDTAIVNADFVTIYSFIDRGCFPPDYQVRAGITPLMAAALANNVAAIGELCNREANVRAISNVTGWPALFYACHKGHYDAVVDLNRRLAAVSFDFGFADPQGRTCLIVAAPAAGAGTIRALLSMGVPVASVDNKNSLALHHAVTADNRSAVATLLSVGSDVNATDDAGRTSLFLAAEQGNTNMMRILLQDNASVHTANNERTTPLMAASVAGHRTAVQVLLQNGADALAKDRVGRTAIDLAGSDAVTAALNIIDTCLAAGDIDSILEAVRRRNFPITHESPGGITPLLAAVQLKNAPVVARLVRMGADPNQIALVSGQTALEVAISHNATDVVRELVLGGADVHFVCAQGLPPVAQAYQNGDAAAPIMQLLLQAGANPNWTFSDATSLLQRSCSQWHLALAQILVEHGANVTYRDPSGGLPILSAAEAGDRGVEIVRLLAQYGADVNQVHDVTGASAATIAVSLGAADLFDTLVELGADLTWCRDSGDSALSFARGLKAEADKLAAAAAAPAQVSPAADAQPDDADSDEEEEESDDVPDAARIAKKLSAEVVNRMYATATEFESMLSSRDFAGVLQLIERGNIAADTLTGDGLNAMSCAVAYGDLKAVQSLLVAGANIDMLLPNLCTPLSAALDAGQHAVALELVARGCSLELPPTYNATPLVMAASQGWRDVVQLILSQVGKVGEANRAGRDHVTPLAAAALAGHAGIVEDLMAAGAGVVTAAPSFSALRSTVAAAGHAAVTALLSSMSTSIDTDLWDSIELLVQRRNFHIDYESDQGVTALMAAALSGDVNIVQRMLNLHANVNAESSVTKCSALVFAARRGYNAVVLKLLESGANADATDNHGRSTLYHAAANGLRPAVHALLAAGAPVAMKTRVSPLMAAATAGHMDVFRDILLAALQSGAVHATARAVIRAEAYRNDLQPVVTLCDALESAVTRGAFEEAYTVLSGPLGQFYQVDQVMSNGHTALSAAASAANLTAMRRFIALGANVDYRLPQAPRSTVLHLAGASGSVDAVRVALDNGADMTVCDDQGRTLASLAVEQGHLSIVKYLVDRVGDMQLAARTLTYVVPGVAPQTLLAVNWLELAFLHGQAAVAKYLIDQGAVTSGDADVNACLARITSEPVLKLLKAPENLPPECQAVAQIALQLARRYRVRMHSTLDWFHTTTPRATLVAIQDALLQLEAAADMDSYARLQEVERREIAGRIRMDKMRFLELFCSFEAQDGQGGLPRNMVRMAFDAAGRPGCATQLSHIERVSFSDFCAAAIEPPPALFTEEFEAVWTHWTGCSLPEPSAEPVPPVRARAASSSVSEGVLPLDLEAVHGSGRWTWQQLVKSAGSFMQLLEAMQVLDRTWSIICPQGTRSGDAAILSAQKEFATIQADWTRDLNAAMTKAQQVEASFAALRNGKMRTRLEGMAHAVLEHRTTLPAALGEDAKDWFDATRAVELRQVEQFTAAAIAKARTGDRDGILAFRRSAHEREATLRTRTLPTRYDQWREQHKREQERYDAVRVELRNKITSNKRRGVVQHSHVPFVIALGEPVVVESKTAATSAATTPATPIGVRRRVKPQRGPTSDDASQYYAEWRGAGVVSYYSDSDEESGAPSASGAGGVATPSHAAPTAAAVAAPSPAAPAVAVVSVQQMEMTTNTMPFSTPPGRRRASVTEFLSNVGKRLGK